ncbi:glycoside hydrolase family 16 protein [Luteolibacter sp. LG18]|uniref:glycoside hydrolase family 16 protein n=1 Tax=Luteolibacter sp. LG18 TaxID=2819286 RepID=UPI002B2F52A9|nr:beta-glucanase [Luteolibacter sp. LG18]
MSNSPSFPKWGLALALPALLATTGCDSPAKAKQASSPGQNTRADETAVPPGIQPAAADQWQLVWRDEFEGAAFDPTKWDYRYLGPRDGAIMTKDCITVENGLMRVWVREKDGQLLNGMVSTHKKFETLHGIIAGRIRFPRQQGQHGSLWMQPSKGEKIPDNPARSGAEIDIVEWFGHGRKDGGIASNLYWPGVKDGTLDIKANHAGGTHPYPLLPAGEILSDNFHVFSVEWTPTEYVFRIDGNETQRVSQGVSQVPQYLILSLFSAAWEAPRLDRTQLPNSMDVDWVRVWQRNSAPAQEVTRK